MPTKAGDKRAIPTGFNAAALLPTDRSYFRFEGSLTTPPCSEGVRWLVLRTAVSVSRAVARANCPSRDMMSRFMRDLAASGYAAVENAASSSSRNFP
jgi:carbonic anhydrase